MNRKRLVCLLLSVVLFSAPVFAGDYVIGDGDVLQVSVWGVPDLSVPVRVRPDGKITLPAAGDVVASGLTPAQLSRKLGDVLGRFVKEPIVTLTVEEITNNKIYVFGGGVPSATLNLSGRTTLFKLLCQLENIDNTDLKNAYLLRGGARFFSKFHPLFVDGDLSLDFVLHAEDIIYIPTNELNKLYVVGAVMEPKYIFYREGIKVLDAILEAGGFNEFADINDVTVIRKNGDRVRVKLKNLMKGKDVGQNVPLMGGDYIIVSEGMF
jgi:polysaccharide export outer membrane protein